MKKKIEAVFRNVTNDKFERLELIREATVGNVVIKADISTDGVISYYELWNEFEEKMILLAIAPCEREISAEKIEILSPGFDVYKVLQPTRRNIWMLLRWLNEVDKYQIPCSLRQIQQEARSINDILDWEYNEMKEKYLI